MKNYIVYIILVISIFCFFLTGIVFVKEYLWKGNDEKVVRISENGNGKGKADHKKAKDTVHLNETENVIQKYLENAKIVHRNILLGSRKIAKFPDQNINLNIFADKTFVYHKIDYRSSNKKVASVDSEGIVKTKRAGYTTITVSVSLSGYRILTQKIRVRVKDSDKVVALTFDDGPVHENTSRLLKALKKYDYHVTFFMMGNRVSGNEDVLKKMIKNGHELGTHTWDHPNLVKLSESSIKENVQKARKAMYDACGQYPTVMRPPYGNINSSVRNVCREYHMPVILWNVDIEDWRTRDANTVKTKLLNQVHPGAVFVLHDLHKSSVTGVIRALPELKKRGYELVTVSELAELKGQELKPGEKFFGTSK